MCGGLAHCPYLQTTFVWNGAVVAVETAQVALDPYQAFQAQSIHKELDVIR